MTVDSEEFLRAFHNDAPGATSQCMGWGRVRSGKSSYQELADVVPAQSLCPRVLELACGDGFLVPILQRRNPRLEYLGVDISDRDLENARDQYQSETVRFELERVHDTSAEDRAIDFVLSHMALMLFDDLDRVLAEATRVLVPGGSFTAVIGAPPEPNDTENVYAIYARAVHRSGLSQSPRLGDSRLRTREGIASLFDDADGLRLDEIIEDELVLDGNREDVFKSLALTYDLAATPAAERAAFYQGLEQEIASLESSTGVLPYRFALRTIHATRIG